MERLHSAFLSDALVVGWPEIDAQHEQIFAFLETLKSSCFGSRCLLMEGFRRLVMDFEQHFTDEERLADAFGLGGAAHEIAHQDTLRTIRGSLQGVLCGAVDAYSFLRYMEFWLERHIVHFDKPFVAEMKKCGRLCSSPGLDDARVG